MKIMSDFKLNIAQRGPKPGWDGKPQYFHFALVELPSHRESEAILLAQHFAEKFPAPEFSLTLTHWQTRGVDVEWRFSEGPY
jgi:hypothetical protein